ncbi:hypothetical protein H9Q72_000474 [Fusarium xylarioides]|uniref:Glutamine amidotransferase domain-containing protein n=1 Tax=Fusarium xylarioides TaxID=221167 RepID=A0A9P7ICI1_9HYPO|nr:hypothetical protein H9Q70_000341 [Fusarium xylarioides]KAG5773948.1 hypothetical protein H9Q72_000474 [Fusarium xylarioides]KAG5786296.1 hypothetical protein H9Q73_000030 [Fusarium xylarioides]KAG5819146.1 hypothetical protein H9Q71_001097 [Fusarium xylarioides]KAG5829188.1 hypothetical protein H9Q74_000768 [Fusarium xylarioides]
MAAPRKPLRMDSHSAKRHQDRRPDIEISIFDPIGKQEYPNLDNDKYDAIILSGGTTEHDSTIPWVDKMQRFVRDTVVAHPDQTLIGICWGQQAVHKALGGVVKRIPTGPFVNK